jgi:hypothetical protein
MIGLLLELQHYFILAHIIIQVSGFEKDRVNRIRLCLIVNLQVTYAEFDILQLFCFGDMSVHFADEDRHQLTPFVDEGQSYGRNTQLNHSHFYLEAVFVVHDAIVHQILSWISQRLSFLNLSFIDICNLQEFGEAICSNSNFELVY